MTDLQLSALCRPARRAFLGLAVCALTLVTSASAWAQKKTTHVGVVVDGDSPFYETLGTAFGDELKALTAGEFQLEAKPEHIVRCDFERKCIEDGVQKLLDDPEVDLVITHGFIGSTVLLEMRSLKKPALAPFVLDPKAQGLDPSRRRPNLGYMLWDPNLARQLRVLSQLVNFETIAALFTERPWTALSGNLSEYVVAEGKAAGVEVTVVPVGNTAEAALAALPEGVDAVYTGPLLDMSVEERRKLAAALAAKQLPSFSFLGEEGVEDGFLAGTVPKSDTRKMARRFALGVQSMLLGDAPETVRSRFGRSEKLFLNGPLAAALGVAPDVQTLLDTTIVGGQPSAEEHAERLGTQVLSLQDAVRLALAGNLSLAAARFGVRVAGNEARRARAPLLPQLSLDVAGRVIDDDRAFGIEQEWQAYYQATASQSIFDERSWGSFKAAQYAVRAEEEARQGVELDIVGQVATAYFRVLKATTTERIQQQDLVLSQENLDMARIRARVGQAGREEVFRWESRIATSRRLLLDASAQKRQAMVQLAVLMNRNAARPIPVVDVTKDTPGMLSADDRFTSALGSPRRFEHLQDYLVQEGLARAPELRQLEAQMGSVRRQLRAERRSYYLPSISLSGQFKHRFAQTEPPPSPINGIFSPDEFDFQAALGASIPFFEGGLKDASIDKGRAQLNQLSFQKQEAARQLESGVRQSLFAAAASYASIEITEAAERAAQGNLNIVRDKYQRGRATIIELLDAQNEVTVALNESANAEFSFLEDVISVERSLGRFSLFESPEENARFFERFERFSLSGASGSREQPPVAPAK